MNSKTAEVVSVRSIFDGMREKRIAELRRELEAVPRLERLRVWRELRAAISSRSPQQITEMERQRGLTNA